MQTEGVEEVVVSEEMFRQAMFDPGRFVARQKIDGELEHEKNCFESLIDWQWRALRTALEAGSQDPASSTSSEPPTDTASNRDAPSVADQFSTPSVSLEEGETRISRADLGVLCWAANHGAHHLLAPSRARGEVFDLLRRLAVDQTPPVPDCKSPSEGEEGETWTIPVCPECRKRIVQAEDGHYHDDEHGRPHRFVNAVTVEVVPRDSILTKEAVREKLDAARLVAVRPPDADVFYGDGFDAGAAKVLKLLDAAFGEENR